MPQCNTYSECFSSAKVRFSNTFIKTADGKTAKDVTFHPDIKMRSVTLEGDVYAPSGTLSGGKRSDTTKIGYLYQKKKVN